MWLSILIHIGRISRMDTRKVGASLQTTPSDRPRVSHYINDNYCLHARVCAQRLTGRRKTVNSCQTLDVNLIVADHVPFAVGQPQKKSLSPNIV